MGDKWDNTQQFHGKNSHSHMVMGEPIGVQGDPDRHMVQLVMEAPRRCHLHAGRGRKPAAPRRASHCVKAVASTLRTIAAALAATMLGVGHGLQRL